MRSMSLSLRQVNVGHVVLLEHVLPASSFVILLVVLTQRPAPPPPRAPKPQFNTSKSNLEAYKQAKCKEHGMSLCPACHGDDYLRNRVKKAVSGSLKRLGLRRTKSYLCYLGTNSWFPVLDHLKSKRQHWNAQQPGAHMTLTNSAIDHIRPVREFQKHGVGAKTLLCNHYTNLQLLQESARGQQLEVRRLVLRGRGPLARAHHLQAIKQGGLLPGYSTYTTKSSVEVTENVTV